MNRKWFRKSGKQQTTPTLLVWRRVCISTFHNPFTLSCTVIPLFNLNDISNPVCWGQNKLIASLLGKYYTVFRHRPRIWLMLMPGVRRACGATLFPGSSRACRVTINDSLYQTFLQKSHYQNIFQKNLFTLYFTGVYKNQPVLLNQNSYVPYTTWNCLEVCL